jgi:hypothetical protein
MLDLRLCVALSVAPCLFAIGCSSGGGTGGSTGTGTTTGGTTVTSTTGTTATGTTTSATTATGTTTGGGTTTASSTGSGGMCAIHGGTCNPCVTGMCMSQFTACAADTTCKADVTPGGTVDTCVCNAQNMNNTAAADTCITNFGATGNVEKGLADCLMANCKTACGF